MKKLIIALASVGFIASSSIAFAAKPEGVGGGKPDFAGQGKPAKVGGGKPDGVGGGKPDGVGGGKPDGVGGGNAGRIDICHNGETFDEETAVNLPVSFVITVSRNALRAHLENHDDCDALIEELGPIEVCELEDDGTIACEEKIGCNCLDPEIDPLLP